MQQHSRTWRMFVALILGIALGAVALAQQDDPVDAPPEPLEEEPPIAAEEEPPIALEALEPPDTDPVVVVAEGRGFAALRGPEVLWRIAHAPDTGPVSGPIVAPGGLIYAHGVRVLRVDPTTGRITGAWWLSGPIAGLAREGDIIEATVVTGATGVTERFRIDPAGESGQLDRPMTPGTDVDSRSWLRREARSIAPGAFDTPGRLPPGELTTAASRLVDSLRRDPTNPWTALGLGRIFLVLGRVADADAVFEFALEPGRPAYEYGAMAAVLEAAGLHPLADRAADRAESAMAATGHEPDLATSTLAAAATYDPRALAAAAFRDGRYDRGRAWLERAVRVAPRLEGYESVYSQYGDWLEGQGQIAAAAAWRSRLQELQTDTLLGLGEHANLRVAAQAINLFLGLAMATVALLLYLFVRAWRAQGQDLAGRGGRFGSWLRSPFLRARHTSLGYATFTEKLVVFGLAVAAYIALVGAAWMTSGARQDFAVPFVIASGQLGGAESRTYLADRATATREGRWLLALAMHAGGDHAGAQAIYEELVAQTGRSAPILVNLGAMAELQGETAEALALYRNAIEQDPGLLEARVNAARLGDAAMPGALAVIQRDRLEFHDRYSSDRPLLAVPTPAQVAGALGATRRSFVAYLAPNRLIEETPEAWRQVRGQAGTEWVVAITAATALWVIVAFIFVLVPPPGPRGPHGPVPSLTGLLLPGTALAEEPWGFLVLLASGYAAILTLAGFLWGPPGILGPVVSPVDLGLGVAVHPGVAPIPIEQWAPWALVALYAINAIALSIGWLRPKPRPVA